MKTFYYVAVETEDGQNYAFVMKVKKNENLLSKLCKNCSYVQPCETKKEAIALANYWNDCYIKNGTYIFY